MSARTLEDQVSALLSRNVAETKQVGAPRPGLEASAVFDSIALSLVFKPRGGLYFAVMARNALTKVVQEEISLLDQLLQDIADLANPAYKISGAPTLRRAQVALLNLESLPRINSSSVALDLYNKSVSEFLEKHLSKNVRRLGKSELVRPAAEAAQDLPSTFAAVTLSHSELLDRLYALATGIENFEAAPFGALIGTATVARARADLDSIVSLVEDSGSAEHARDMAVRLIGSRSTINTVAAPPKWNDALLTDALGATSVGAASVTGSVSHPFTMPTASVLAIETAGAAHSFGFFPGDSALLISRTASFPITIPSGYGLFLTYTVGGIGTSVRIPMDGTFSNAAGVAAKIMDAGVTGLQATSFANATDRLLLFMTGAEKLAVSPVYVMSSIEAAMLGVTVPSSVTLTNSAASYIGLADGDTGGQELFADVAVDAINSLFGAWVSATSTADGRISISTLSQAPGVTLRVFGSAAAAFGFEDVTKNAETKELVLTGVADHTEILQVEDLVLCPDGTTATLDEVYADSVVLKTPVKTFSGKLSAKSCLVTGYAGFISALKRFLSSWEATPYVSNLDVVDRALAPLTASQSPAQRNEAAEAVAALRVELTKLLNVLTDASTMLPSRAALAERKMVDGILNTLAERNYGRAIDLLLKCDLQALLEMDDSTASYGGNFMKVSSELARTSIKVTGSGDSTEPTSYSGGFR